MQIVGEPKTFLRYCNLHIQAGNLCVPPVDNRLKPFSSRSFECPSKPPSSNGYKDQKWDYDVRSTDGQTRASWQSWCFVATVGGNFLSPNDSLIAAIIATPLFAALYVCVRANFSEIFSSNVATPGLMGSWLKK